MLTISKIKNSKVYIATEANNLVEAGKKLAALGYVVEFTTDIAQDEEETQTTREKNAHFNYLIGNYIIIA